MRISPILCGGHFALFMIAGTFCAHPQTSPQRLIEHDFTSTALSKHAR